MKYSPPTSIKAVQGFTLVELIVFITVVATVMGSLSMLFSNTAINTTDPLLMNRALQCAKTKMDEISVYRFSDSTPVGGIPACGSGQSGSESCSAIVGAGNKDDIGDFHGQIDTSLENCRVEVAVVEGAAGIRLIGVGAAQSQMRQITVTAKSGAAEIILSRYHGNF